MLKKGLLLAFITAFISGIANFVGKVAVMKIDPLLFTTLKNVGAFIFLAVFFLSVKQNRAAVFRKPNRKELRNLILIAIIGGSIPFYLFFEGLRQIPAINGALIHKSLIIWVAILAWPFLGEKLKLPQVVGVALLFASNFIIGGFKGFTFSTGELMILAATILWAVENMIAKKTLATVPSSVVSLWRMGGGGLILVAMLMIRGIPGGLPQFNPQQLGIIALTSFLLFGYVATWYTALATNKVTTVASILVSATIVTNVLSAIFVTHVLKPIDIVQSAMMITGIGIVLYFSKQKLEQAQPQLSAV